MTAEYFTAAKLAPLLSKVAALTAESAKGPLARKKDEFKIKLKFGFEAYISQQISRYSFVKTIIGSSIPLSLEDLYINQRLSVDNNEVRDDDFLKIIDTHSKVVFTATAGSGKSMLMRYLYFLFLKEQDSKIPVFVELRDLNDTQEISIMQFITDRIAEHIDNFTIDQTRYCLRNGLIVIFMDGFDEIDHDKRLARSREINRIAGRYEKSVIFVSSRPDPGFAAWSRFYTYHLKQFTEKQVRSLIDRVPYDEEIKKLFIKKLDGGLYKTHREFLVNPLLTLMMLVTLEQFAEVPAKIHLFYEYAFEALFARHDVTKDGFLRKRHVSIALDDYRRLFSYFCTITYLRELVTFSEITTLEHLEKSISSSQIKVGKREMLDDLSQCTCMLVRDGLDYTFSHRSFQEYFVAYFLGRIKVDEFERVAPKLVERGSYDNVFLMISEINREKFEEAWALPILNRTCDKLDLIENSDDVVKLGENLFGQFNIRIESNGRTIGTMKRETIESTSRMFMYRIYNVFDAIENTLPNEMEDAADFKKRVLAGEIQGLDNRFDILKGNDTSSVSSSKVTATDSIWLKETFLGKFIKKEAEVLRKLRNEVSERVEKRREGLASILDL